MVQQQEIKKPWGYEYISVVTDKYVVKKLHIQAEHSTSVQYHNIKDKHITPISGYGFITYHSPKTLQEVNTESLQYGVWRHIEPKTIHRLWSNEGCILFEVSTPELDDVIILTESSLVEPRNNVKQE